MLEVYRLLLPAEQDSKSSPMHCTSVTEMSLCDTCSTVQLQPLQITGDVFFNQSVAGCGRADVVAHIASCP